ncbi:uncharacterized protein LOC116266733 [Nymphaea colorata]|nr:uncharacterized protein LOC116266733 [Nymphaea colorata]
MDARPMYNESFSYSWVLHLKPSSFDASGDLHSRKFSIDSLDDGPFIEIDLLKMTPLLTATAAPTTTTTCTTTTTASSNHHCHGSNDFIFPTSQPLTLVPADRLFLDGHLLPLHLTHLEPELLDSAASPPESTDSSDAPGCPRQRQTFFQRCRTSIHRIFRKLNRSQRRPAGRKSRSSVSDVSTVNETARKECAEVGYGGMGSGHRWSVDDGMLHPQRSSRVADNLGTCFSCPTTPGHESHV